MMDACIALLYSEYMHTEKHSLPSINVKLGNRTYRDGHLRSEVGVTESNQFAILDIDSTEGKVGDRLSTYKERA